MSFELPDPIRGAAPGGRASTAAKEAANQLVTIAGEISSGMSGDIQLAGKTVGKASHILTDADRLIVDSSPLDDTLDEAHGLSVEEVTRRLLEDEPNHVVTGLGSHVDYLLAQSDSVNAVARRIIEEEWTIRYGPAGEGTYARRSDKSISIDSRKQGDPGRIIAALAHELGHANFPDPVQRFKPGETREEWIERNKKIKADGEGEATIMQYTAQREITEKGWLIQPVSDELLGPLTDYYQGNCTRAEARRELGYIIRHNINPSIKNESGEFYGTYENLYNEKLTRIWEWHHRPENL